MTAKKRTDQLSKNLKDELNKLEQRGKSIRFDNDSRFEQAAMAERANEAQRILGEAFKLYNSNRQVPAAHEVWQNAAATFERARQEAYPPSFQEDWWRLKQGDPAGLETAISFLEADPWFFGSGYAKAELIRLINKCELSDVYRRRLQNVVLAVLETHDRREFRSYCRLAKKVYSERFRAELLTLLNHTSSNVRRRAQWVLDACNKPK
jgi:hypothetical protein